jgi:hypothetical protein
VWVPQRRTLALLQRVRRLLLLLLSWRLLWRQLSWLELPLRLS